MDKQKEIQDAHEAQRILESQAFKKAFTDYKNQLKIPASILIGLTGLYWFVESII